MSLLKKIVIMFFSITIISSIAFLSVGKKIIDEVSMGELERGPGRTNSVISRINGEVTKLWGKTVEFSNYYDIKNNLQSNYEEVPVNKIIDIEKKAEFSSVSSIFLLENGFSELNKIFDKDNISKEELNFIRLTVTNLIKNSIKEEEPISGMISGGSYSYLIGGKKIKSENDKYIIMAERIDEDFIEKLSKETNRIVDIVNGNKISEDFSKMEVSNIGDREYFSNRQEEKTDVYTNLKTIENSEYKYYIKLTDDRNVRNNAEKNIYLLVATMIVITILSNLVLYLILKKSVINRILKIKNTINSVRENTKFNMELIEDNKDDEIGELNNDLNSMFKRLKSYSENLEFISRQDTLTKLKNRYSINEYILSLTTKKEDFAIFFIDLDNFKVINDTLGHHIGDKLLVKVSEVLYSIVEEEKNLTVGRIGGDEFIIVRNGKNDLDEIKRVASKVIKKINKCYEFNSYMYEIKASMGISFYSEHSTKGSEILQYSDIAMYCSKRDGGNRYTIFEEQMLEPLRIEKRLKKAIEKKEFKMYLQPIYNVKKDTIQGYEALVRWYDGDQVIAPYKFIPLAKRTGDIVGIDNFIFKEALRMVRELIDCGKEEFYISLNASKLFLKQENLIEFIKSELEKYNVESKYIKMEVAEDEIIDDFEYTIALLDKLRNIGIEIYLDDFGVGYSSFSHIKKLPIDVIKLDRSLIIDIESNIKSQEIVKTLINMAHNMNVGIICEGIEENEQVNILRNFNCDNIQGYYFGKPVPKVHYIDEMKKENMKVK